MGEDTPTLRPQDFVRIAVPRWFKREHREKGGKKLRRWVCYLNRGVIRVMASVEPCADDGGMAWHVSISVAETDESNQEPFRKPEDYEVEAALQLIYSKGKPREWKELPCESLTRHFFDG